MEGEKKQTNFCLAVVEHVLVDCLEQFIQMRAAACLVVLVGEGEDLAGTIETSEAGARLVDDHRATFQSSSDPSLEKGGHQPTVLYKVEMPVFVVLTRMNVS